MSDVCLDHKCGCVVCLRACDILQNINVLLILNQIHLKTDVSRLQTDRIQKKKKNF